MLWVITVPDNEDSPRRDGRWRFRVIVVLIGMAVCVIVSILALHAYSQQKIRNWVAQHGGRTASAAWLVIVVDLREGDVSSRDVEYLKNARGIRAIYLAGEDLDDRACDVLSTMPSLVEVDLS